MALHAEGKLVGTDAGGHFGVGVQCVEFIHALQEVEGPALALRGDTFRRIQIQDRTGTRAEDRPLIDGGQEPRAPAGCAAFGRTFWLRHHNVGGEVVALAAEPVGDPRPHRRVAHQNMPGIDVVHGRGVDGAVGIEGPDEAEVIHMLRRVGEEGGDIHAALAVFGKLPGAGEQRSVAFGELADDGAVAGGQRLAVVFGEGRFRVESVDMAGATDHEKEDDGFGFGRKVGGFGGEGVGTGSGLSRRQQGCQGNRPEAVSGAGQHVAARDRSAEMITGHRQTHFC